MTGYGNAPGQGDYPGSTDDKAHFSDQQRHTGPTFAPIIHKPNEPARKPPYTPLASAQGPRRDAGFGYGAGHSDRPQRSAGASPPPGDGAVPESIRNETSLSLSSFVSFTLGALGRGLGSLGEALFRGLDRFANLFSRSFWTRSETSSEQKPEFDTFDREALLARYTEHFQQQAAEEARRQAENEAHGERAPRGEQRDDREQRRQRDDRERSSKPKGDTSRGDSRRETQRPDRQGGNEGVGGGSRGGERGQEGRTKREKRGNGGSSGGSQSGGKQQFRKREDSQGKRGRTDRRGGKGQGEQDR